MDPNAVRELEKVLDSPPSPVRRPSPTPVGAGAADGTAVVDPSELIAKTGSQIKGWSPQPSLSNPPLAGIEHLSELPPTHSSKSTHGAKDGDSTGGQGVRVASIQPQTTEQAAGSSKAGPDTAEAKAAAPATGKATKKSKKGGKPNAANGVPPKYPKRKKLTKAERRALQEKQRREKAERLAAAGKLPQKKGGKKGGGKDSAARKSGKAGAGGAGSQGEQQRGRGGRGNARVQLFAHLAPHTSRLAQDKLASIKSNVHPAFVRIGIKYAKGIIVGANSRSIALLRACQEAVRDHVTPSSTYFSKAFIERLNPMISYIVKCRPLSISMGNVIRFVKRLISPLPADMADDDAKQFICSSIDDFIDKRIIGADKLIVRNVLGKEPNTTPKIVTGDVVLTHGKSSVVEMILLEAKSSGIDFRVIVVDSRPRMEGRKVLQTLTAAGISCTYVLLTSLAYVMPEATKVLLGAGAMMANGAALNRVGSAVVSMEAHSHRKPVIVCCETYKFCERVQIDSIVSNELADPSVLAMLGDDEPAPMLEGWQDVENLHLLNLNYDLTPQEFITLIATDVGMIPPTSVPVIIREFLADRSQ